MSTEALEKIAQALTFLGTGMAATEMGAIEYLAKATEQGCTEIASGLHDVADAIREATEEKKKKIRDKPKWDPMPSVAGG